MMRKIKLQTKTYPTLFPSLSDTLQLFDFPAGPADILRLISRETDTELPVDSKTLKVAEREGVKRQTVSAIIKYILSHIHTFDSIESSKYSPFNHSMRRSIREAIHHPGSGREWSLFLPRFLQSAQLKFPHAERFINDRFAAERKLYTLEGSDAEKMTYAIELYAESFLADPNTIRSFLTTLLNQGNTTRADTFQVHKELIGILLTDFYFWLLAYIELDIAESIANEVTLSEEEQATVDCGLFQRIMPKYEDGRIVYSVHQLLDRWRQLYSVKVLKKEEIISISGFATLLPDALLSDSKPDDMYEEQRRLSKYRMLCAWRTGQKIPSDDKLRGFIENILRQPCREREMWFWFAKTAIAIDRLFNRIKAENVYTIDELTRVFQRYSIYNRQIRRQAAHAGDSP